MYDPLTFSHRPTMENLEAYLGSIGRVQEAIDDLNKNNLGFCRVTVRRLETASGMAVEALAMKYKEWLTMASVVIDPAGQDSEIPELSPQLAANLKRIAEYSAGSEMHGEVLGYYGEVRSNYLLHTLQVLFRNVDAPVKGTYQRATHPFIIAVREFFKLAQRETNFANQVLPKENVEEAVRKAINHPADLVKMSAETVATRVRKAVGKHEFVDQIWIFDVIEVFNDLWVGCEMANVKEVIKPALISVTSSGVELLKELMDDVQGTSRTTATLAASANATVFEQTSTLLNCLKRLLDYERILEALLSRWAHKDWDYVVGPIETESQVFAMALYYRDLLKGLEVIIEKYSHGYKKPMTSVLFQLNNYNYILHTFKSSTLSAMVTIEEEQKYESIVDALLNEYLQYWRHSSALLDDHSERAIGIPPKDRLKMFAAELEEHVKGQECCAVPDGELRVSLVEKVRGVVTANFIPFYNMYLNMEISH